MDELTVHGVESDMKYVVVMTRKREEDEDRQ